MRGAGPEARRDEEQEFAHSDNRRLWRSSPKQNVAASILGNAMERTLATSNISHLAFIPMARNSPPTRRHVFSCESACQPSARFERGRAKGEGGREPKLCRAMVTSLSTNFSSQVQQTNGGDYVLQICFGDFVPNDCKTCSKQRRCSTLFLFAGFAC
jgi:hypothetical protein